MSNRNRDSALYRGSRTGDPRVRERHQGETYTEPGRIPGEDSLGASGEENPRDDDGYDYTGFKSPAATKIGDSNEDDPKIQRLRKHHEGRHQSDGEHSAREAEWDKRRVAQAICSALPLNPREKDHVVAAVESLDLDCFGNQKNITKVTLGLVAVIVDEQYREDADDIEHLVRYSEKFCAIRDKHNVSMSDLNTVKGIVRDRLGSRSVPVSSEVGRHDPALPGPTTPDELPRQYWEELPPQSWISIARSWEQLPEEYKDAIPAGHRETVELLRKWEPWDEGDSSGTDDHEERATSSSSDLDDAIVAAEAAVAELLDPDGDG